MKSKSSIDKKALILLISTILFLVCGFVFFFTDLISADSSALPAIQTTTAPKADASRSYKLQAMSTVDAISTVSQAKLGYKWNPNQAQTINGKEVKGAWVDNNGKVWTNEGHSQTDIELHSALNQALYVANQTVDSPVKSNALELDKQIKAANAIMVKPATVAASANNKVVIAAQVVSDISDGYLGYIWNPDKVWTLNGKQVTGAWVNDSGDTWDRAKHTPAENLLHDQCNETLAAYNQAKTNPAAVNHADALNKQLQITLAKPDIQAIKVKSDKELIQQISEDYLGYKWDGTVWSKDGVSWASSNHTEAETILHNGSEVSGAIC
jgi:hypothetical protein